MTLCNVLLGRYDDALKTALKCKSLAPDYVRGQHRLVAALAYAGKEDEAKSALDELLTMQPDMSVAYFEDTYPFANPSDRNVLVDGLRRAGWRA